MTYTLGMNTTQTQTARRTMTFFDQIEELEDLRKSGNANMRDAAAAAIESLNATGQLSVAHKSKIVCAATDPVDALTAIRLIEIK